MWKVGQTVWCLARGKGEVTSVAGDTVEVFFDKSNKRFSYNLLGHSIYTTSTQRLLYFSEPKIDAAVVPPSEPKFKRGAPIIVCGQGRGFEGALFGYVVEETETLIKVDAGSTVLNWGKDKYVFLDPTGLAPVKF